MPGGVAAGRRAGMSEGQDRRQVCQMPVTGGWKGGSGESLAARRQTG